jgi:class 3 adenylate cyclase
VLVCHESPMSPSWCSGTFSSSPHAHSPECPAVTAAPETRYTRSADGANLAYQVSGDGPVELLFLHVAYPIELLVEDPGFLRLRRRLDGFSRNVWFDTRGNGASEGDFRDGQRREVSDADILAVFDAVGFEKAALVAEGMPGSAIRFSLDHPDRVSSLVLINSAAHFVREEDYPYGVPRDLIDSMIADHRDNWGDPAVAIQLLAPSRVADERFKAWYARTMRFSAGPNLVADMVRVALEEDVRPLLSAISHPTVVLHREGDLYVEVGAGQYLAEHIEDARFVALPGDDHLFFVGDTDALVDEVEEFLTGVRSGAEGDVVMASVLFTDIVASTEYQARVGPREWSRLSDHHDAMVRAALVRHRGHEVKTMGDGFLATFDATARALRCAEEILAGATDIGLDLRAGVHTGEVAVRGDDIGGLAVTIAKRVCDLAGPSQVLVSETVRTNMVGSDVEFNSHGVHELKGVPGYWPLYTFAASP